jgi:predicted nucleotidyltransferase
MNNFQKILDSFSIKDTLNPKIWENPKEPNKSVMIPKVRKALMRISEEFIDYLGDDVFVDDIHLTGSLANFNWSEFSDFDLHVIVDLQQYENQSEIYKELFNLKKQVFNDKHNIKIFGYDVELYAQDTEEAHYSSGVFSIMNNEWINKPKKLKNEVDKMVLEKKIKSWTDKIETSLKDGKNLEELKDKLKEYRQSGLEKDGELSYENLVFKYLRRSGHVEKLFDTLNKEVDKELSVERKIVEQVNGQTIKDKILAILNSSEFLTKLNHMYNQNMVLEYTPGMKLPYSEEAKLIQEALQFLGFSLPTWGVDGKFGPETQKATKLFQEKMKLPSTGKIGKDELKYIISSLIADNFKDSDLSKIKFNKENTNGSFTYLDLNTSEGYEQYKNICQKFINDRNPSAGVSGEMMAECAKQNFSKGYVPPELALAQLATEGGLSSDPNSKPIRTQNPFNVGNVDSGQVKNMTNVESGVCAYYNLMTSNYLPGGKKAEDLVNNFVNTSGERYAAEKDYEGTLKQIINKMGQYRQDTGSDVA